MTLTGVCYHYDTPDEYVEHKEKMLQKGFEIFDEDYEYLWIEYECRENWDLSGDHYENIN